MFTFHFLNCRGSAALALLLLAPAPWANAQRDAAAAEQEDFILRTYEVGDLVVDVPDYSSTPGAGSTTPAGFGGRGFGGGGGGFGGGGGGFFSVPDDGATGFFDFRSPQGQPPANILSQFGGGGRGGRTGGRESRGASPGADPMAISFDSLIDAMTNVVAPDTWQENGTGDGAVRVVGAALVVWQTRDVHARIEDFLQQLRQGSARRRTVTIDARWLLLNSDDLDRLNPPDDEGQPAVDRRVLAEFTRRATSLRGLTNCFSGQAVYLISGTRRNVVSGYIPVVGSVERPQFKNLVTLGVDGESVLFVQDGGDVAGPGNRGVGYQPVVEKPNFGVQLQVRPTMVLKENAAVVDLISTITFPAGVAAAELDAGPLFQESGAPRVDRLAIDAQELATTLRVPLGKPVLVGGMSYIAPAAGAKDDAAPPDEETRQLYLILEVR
jgi:hypothetical protein